MISISSEYTTKTILTVDDLNGVDRDQLIQETQEAIPKGSLRPDIIPDRTEAIFFALEEAPENSVVIITGKGPEKYKETYTHPSDSDLKTVELFQSMNKPTLI